MHSQYHLRPAPRRPDIRAGRTPAMLPAGWAAARLATTMSLVAMAAVTVLGRSAAAWTGGAIVVITASLAWRQLELAPMVASLPPTTRLPRG